MLGYAASGRHYWTASDFRSHAQDAAGDESTLNQKLKDLTGKDIDPEDFFAAMERNLQRSKMRLIFFLEESPLELRSIVEFLNGQMKDMEVLIVEARQYQQGDARIVVPWVFGFTEEARVAKKGSRPESVGPAGSKGEAAFWESFEASALKNEWKSRIRDFVTAAAATAGCQITWQRSCIISLPAVVPQKILLAIRRTGILELYLARWQPTEDNEITDRQLGAKKKFFADLQSIFEMTPDDLEKGWPQLSPERWIAKSSDLTESIRRLAAFCGD